MWSKCGMHVTVHWKWSLSETSFVLSLFESGIWQWMKVWLSISLIRVVGPRCSVDEDGCVGSPCNTTAACQDLTPSVQQSRGLTYQCSSCSVGYTLSSSLKCTGNFCVLFEDAKMRLKNTYFNIYMIFVFNTLNFNILFKFCRCWWMCFEPLSLQPRLFEHRRFISLYMSDRVQTRWLQVPR